MNRKVIKQGDKFGKLTSLKLDYIKKQTIPKKGNKNGISNLNIQYWLFKCDCGNEKVIDSRNVRSGNTTSCGCYFKEVLKNSNKDKRIGYGQAAKNLLLHSYIKGAKTRDYEFSLSKEEFYLITSQDCDYCGREPIQSIIKNNPSCHGDYLYNGIDRVDNTKGYIFENCVPCCSICNKAKSILTIEEFSNWIKQIVNHNKHLIDA